MHDAQAPSSVAPAVLLLACGPPFLSASHARPYKAGHLPLSIAVASNYKNTVVSLLESPAWRRATNKLGAPLHLAVARERLEIVELLLENHADANAWNDDGNTPLHTAAWAGQTEIAELFLDRGARVDMKNKNGRTPLHLAAWEGHELLVQLLVENRADLNAAEKNGYTALHTATSMGHAHVAKLLVENRASTDIRDQEGDTALHVAAAHGRMEIVKLLASREEANWQPKNYAEFTPSEVACQAHHTEVAIYLRKLFQELLSRTVSMYPPWVDGFTLREKMSRN
eukprot:jgi/Mesvir1/7824/Mv11765-RA.1